MRIGSAKQSYAADAALFDTRTQQAWALGGVLLLVAFPFVANEY
ncbi:MAG: branched-chain amino acid ABC transporter permease, partial [Ideonella sp.]|nr:branched-chain amino acid ABC transporter permease [Ideonella sp.]